MRMISTVVVLCCTVLLAIWLVQFKGVESAQHGATPSNVNTVSRDLAECKMAAMQLGRWDRDAWYWGAPTGQYLVSCMTARGYRRRTINWKQAYNDFSEVADQKKPLYRSQEAEFLVKSGCLDDGNDTLNIALEECWEK